MNYTTQKNADGLLEIVPAEAGEFETEAQARHWVLHHVRQRDMTRETWVALEPLRVSSE